MLEILHWRDIIMTFRMEYVSVSMSPLPIASELETMLSEYDETDKEIIKSNRIANSVIEFKIEGDASKNLNCGLGYVRSLITRTSELVIQWKETGVKLGARYFPETDDNEVITATHGIKVLACRDDSTLDRIREVLLESLVEKGRNDNHDIGFVMQTGAVPQKFPQKVGAICQTYDELSKMKDACITYDDLLEHYVPPPIPEPQYQNGSQCVIL